MGLLEALRSLFFFVPFIISTGIYDTRTIHQLSFSCQPIGTISIMKPKTNWLKTLRENRGYTQEEFTAQLQLSGLDYSRSAVSSWESGRVSAPLNHVEVRQAIANILRIDIKTMLKLAGYEVESKPHSEEAERVAYLIDQLPPDKRNLAVRLVEELAKT